MRTIVITGSSNGIGQYLFEKLSTSYECIGLDIEPSSSKKNTYQVDVSDYNQLKDKLESISYKDIDAVVNCAGICQRRFFNQFTTEDYNYMYNINICGILNMCKLFLPNLTISKGCIINIGSIHAYGTLKEYSVYAMTKGAVESLTRGLAVELSAHDIRVNCIRLGPVRTGMLIYDKEQVGRIPLGRLVGKDDIVKLVEHIVMNSSMTGGIITLDCGITSKLCVEM